MKTAENIPTAQAGPASSWRLKRGAQSSLPGHSLVAHVGPRSQPARARSPLEAFPVGRKRARRGSSRGKEGCGWWVGLAACFAGPYFSERATRSRPRFGARAIGPYMFPIPHGPRVVVGRASSRSISVQFRESCRESKQWYFVLAKYFRVVVDPKKGKWRYQSDGFAGLATTTGPRYMATKGRSIQPTLFVCTHGTVSP